MDKFYAMFWENKVYIEKEHQFLNNEILVSYLNMDYSGLEELYDDLREAAKKMIL